MDGMTKPDNWDSLDAFAKASYISFEDMEKIDMAADRAITDITTDVAKVLRMSEDEMLDFINNNFDRHYEEIA